jgi:hypothetical protein
MNRCRSSSGRYLKGGDLIRIDWSVGKLVETIHRSVEVEAYRRNLKADESHGSCG